MKQYLILALAIAFNSSLMAQVEPQDTDGDGLRNVSTLEQLKWVTMYGAYLDEFENPINFELDNDIDASETASWTEFFADYNVNGFLPIGRSTYMGVLTVGYTGEFNGNGHTISNLYIQSDQLGIGVGLFYKTDEAIIANITLENFNVSSTDMGAASLIMEAYKTNISNCHSSGVVTGESEFIAGLVAYADSCQITDCTANVEIDAKGNNYIGGLVGRAIYYTNINNCHTEVSITDANEYTGGLAGAAGNIGSIINCYTMIDIEGHSPSTAGLVGWNQSSIENSYAIGTITMTGEASDGVGGFVGDNVSPGGTITRCYAMVDISGEDTDAGGFVGKNMASISECYATGDVTYRSTVGGFVGANETETGIITNCYSVGNVIATTAYQQEAGGFVGSNTYQAQIVNCYSIGSVSSPNSTSDKIGGFAGDNTQNPAPYDTYNGIVTNCYWNTETSGMSTSAAGEGKTSAEMRIETSYENWDFSSIWLINANKSVSTLNDGFPVLAQNTPSAINDVVKQIDYKIFPNPAVDKINIQTEETINSILIYDLTGKVLLAVQDDNNTLDISNLNSGLYFVKVTNRKGSTIQKFLKE
ncbi:MAG: T9SS type A sorting domain-containing protein [Bacteroidales bacterium]|nr:T9SS type A sorting domain-containing protein [Bacteroidales bacterium]